MTDKNTATVGGPDVPDALATLTAAFAGARVLVTGHTGFKGPWLLTLLDHLGATTMGYALAPETEPSMYDLINGDALCQSVIADLRDGERLAAAMADFAPEYVLHLGAQSLVRRSYSEPVATFASNVTGTVNVLDAIRRYDGPCSVVIVTTDKVYAPADNPLYAYVESDRLGGHDPYSASKAACEVVVESYQSSYFPTVAHALHGKAIATARAGNVIGGGDWCDDRLLPDIVRAVSNGESVRVRNPSSTRPWQHVLEPLVGYLTLAAALRREPGSFARPFNFGPGAGDALEVEKVVQSVLQVWGTGCYQVDRNPSAPHEAAFLRIDSSAAAEQLDWHPRWDAATAIIKTVEWYRHGIGEPLAFTQRQINEYFESDPNLRTPDPRPGPCQ